MRIYTDIDLSPNIQKFLPLIDEKRMFHKDYNLKHPSALYNVSIGKIENSLREFLEIYERHKTQDFEKSERESTPELLKSYKDFLYCAREYLDDCFHIVKIFIKPPQKVFLERIQLRWLEKNAGTTTKDFFANISEYKKYIDSSVNELKHNNAILGSVAFYNSKDKGECCLGYFIANVIDGAYAPIEKVHPKLGDSYTGFSFRRDITYNLCHIYNLSEEMLIFLRDKIGVDFNVLQPKVDSAPDNKKKLFKDVTELSRIHFPDEYLKPVPSVSITKDERLKLAYPSSLSIKPNKLDRVVVTHSGDGHTREFKLLYM